MGDYRAVIFDMDGVIVDTAKFHFRAWEKILWEHFGVHHIQEVDEKTKGVGRHECMKLILNEYKIALPEKQVYETAEEKNAYYVHLLHTELNQDSILPGVLETLEMLYTNHIPIALASSSYNAPLIVEKLNLHFDYIVYPGDIAHGKPAPDIYLHAAKGLGIGPVHCIGVEDAASGVESIVGANMYCVGIGDNQLLEKSDVIISSTEELHDTLAELLQV